MRRWSKGTVVALVVAVATASGFFAQRPPAADTNVASAPVELSLTFTPLEVRVRARNVAFEISF